MTARASRKPLVPSLPTLLVWITVISVIWLVLGIPIYFFFEARAENFPVFSSSIGGDNSPQELNIVTARGEKKAPK